MGECGKKGGAGEEEAVGTMIAMQNEKRYIKKFLIKK